MRKFLGIGILSILCLTLCSCTGDRTTVEETESIKALQEIILSEIESIKVQQEVVLSEKQMDELTNRIVEKLFLEEQSIQDNKEADESRQDEATINQDDEWEFVDAPVYKDDLYQYRKQICTVGGKTYSIEGYCQAHMNRKGEFLMDDGQKWAVIMREGDKIYPVFGPEYNQLGTVTYDTYLDMNGEKQVLHILVYNKQGGGINIIDYIFDDALNTFKEEKAFKVSNINYFDGDIQIGE
nr:hypothetical protein [uncultured Niameybacter sp.]